MNLEEATWLANVKNAIIIVSVICGAAFAALSFALKLADERVQVWSWPVAERQRAIWEARAKFRALFRSLYYSSFHELFLQALITARAVLLNGLLKPDPVLILPPPQHGTVFNLILFLMTMLFGWVYLMLLQVDLTTSQLVIAKSLTALFNDQMPLLEWDEKTGGWSGWIVTLIALPLFTVVLIAFTAFWGLGVISIWHRLISDLPKPIRRRYKPFSSMPRLIVLSCALTGLALVLGKFTKPDAPIPISPQLYLVNAICDGLSVLIAWYLLRGVSLREKDKPTKRFLLSFVRLLGVATATAALAVVSLYVSLMGTPYNVTFKIAANTLIARPTTIEKTFSAPSPGSLDTTMADMLFEKSDRRGDDQGFAEKMIVAMMFASETGSERFFDQIQQKDGHKFSNEVRKYFDGLKEVAAISYYGSSGYGPYFWLMHTTMFPLLIVLVFLLFYASTFFVRIVTATWARRVSLADKPYGYASICCAGCATFCTSIAALIKLTDYI